MKKNIAHQVFKNPGKKLLTRTGNFFVNFHGVCFFVTKGFKYLVWKKTYKIGILPPTNEYGRLKGLVGADKESLLSPEEENMACEIAKKLAKNPFMGMSRPEITIAKDGFNGAAMELIKNAKHRATVGDFLGDLRL